MKKLIFVISMVLLCNLTYAQEHTRTTYIIDGTETLYIIDGVVSRKAAADNLSSDEIKSMEVVKGIEQAIIITTKGGRKVSGRVVDTDGNPLTGVAVMVPGTKIGVVTDSKGWYMINIPAGEVYLTYAYIDYPTRTVQVDKLEMDDVVMDKNAAENTVVIRKSGETTSGVTPLIVVKNADGEISKVDNLDSLTPDMIKTISVYKDDTTEQFKSYGDISAGVIFVQLK